MRYDQLDSVRGIAAILVFFNHISMVTVTPLIALFFSFYFPLNMLFQGDAAINVFFILSGFVLFLPYTYGDAPPYGIYLVKRFFRVYLPYLLAIVISMILYVCFSKGGIPQLSSWFNAMWTHPLTLHNFFEHIILIGNFNSDLFNNAIWYLVQDMRISIVYPFIAIIIFRYNWKLVFFIGFSLSIISGLNNLFHWEKSFGYHTTFFFTLQYINMVIVGSIVAKHLHDLEKFYRALTKYAKMILLIISFISINYNQFATILSNYARIYYFGEAASDYSVALGTGILIIIALFSPTAKMLLLFKPLCHLGKISYSLYLYHLPVLFTLIYSLYNRLPLWLIFSISIPVTLFIAYYAWLFIETPSLKMGKNAVIKLQGKIRKNRVIRKRKINDLFY
ncbi:acyltransferase family protein [Heyndrickxia acidicola]|uniref:Acyltransferase n=1 Tax=Heyndrickxia acidicola TaxID=209389 RepID=A0ABU6MLP4_9BACI|nr:acyltransferase [Heyndrickxia acidicola]MED1205214.1 acyltransferase [Heyndrickxia acidicola]